jgi:hypothetical protein
MEARIREIGGRTVVFLFISPSPDFCFGFFSSISETVSTSRRAGDGDFGATLGAGAAATGGAVACLGSGSFFFGATFDLTAAGLAAAAFRAAGFFVAVLLVDFVAISVL